MPNYRVICIGTRRSSKIMHSKKRVKQYIKELKSDDKQMKRGNTYIVVKPIKI